jgi:hypothetical protein
MKWFARKIYGSGSRDWSSLKAKDDSDASGEGDGFWV